MTREEAINEIRSWNFLNGKEKEAIQTLVPELRESEEQPKQKKNCNDCPHCVDRKDQFGWHFKGCFGGPYNGKFIAEIDECPLQQEQKLEVKDPFDDGQFRRGYESGYADAKREQKPAEWSEEDADMLNCCISSIEEAKENRYAYKETDGDTSYDREIDWLKSLRPQPHKVSIKDATKFGNLEYERGVKDGIQSEKSHQWKPSEGQMSMLLAVIRDPNNAGSESCSLALKSIYEQLKKMM